VEAAISAAAIHQLLGPSFLNPMHPTNPSNPVTPVNQSGWKGRARAENLRG
jgi:hypothetical protein